MKRIHHPTCRGYHVFHSGGVPGEPIIVTTSTWARNPESRALSQLRNTSALRPGTISINLAGPVRSIDGVSSTSTVTKDDGSPGRCVFPHVLINPEYSHSD
ncbi:hypothetical protein [Corynebacterium ulcerans]|uniref:hypothetical protein n=1 Tax=Corynebacterium ulcerans TaxID=65058 RepID=UPI000269D365|nr:hypothetical protein [Corynebacterium ulcerans]BAM28452.1 hypothetical protein CULC0102_2256 [Corynebacterium ulcerans 0102]